ncbi:MAG: hypothetical protein A3J28_00495 [Acidobacteria bacterium RIFCSPLOWO2_12_FULL_60_22]|nr:MAG: hypothetical protein A3J28_00495 [Acidobacteria bacterium RIFCSPLOWO2_12_FULL_60_22]
MPGLFCLLTVARFSNPALYAQGMGAAIQGTVTDSSGAVIPGATIAATNLETGLQRSGTSNSAGLYAMPNLPPGRYRVQVSMAGFQTNVRENIELVVGQQLALNTALEIGEITQQVTVTGEAPLVNTSTAQVSGLVGERAVKDLPLNGRSFDNLIALNPAAVNTTAIKQGASSSTGSGNYFSIGGRRDGENIFLWNGVEYPGGTTAASSTPGGVSGQLLGIDAVREFNVVPNIDSAEHGHRAGGQINIVTASGTNTFHGSVFEFLRNSALDGRNFFDKGPVPPFKRNQFGGSAGGPIRKDQTFVFGNYEGFRQRLGLSAVAIVPDAQARKGLLPNPQTGIYEPFAGFNPAVTPYFGLWPEPDPDGELFVNGRPTGTALAHSNPLSPIREDFGIARGDHTFSERDTLTGAYTADDGVSTTPAQNPFSVQDIIQRIQVLSLSETHVFSPNVLNNFTAGYSRAWYRFLYSVSTTPSGVAPYVAGKPAGQIAIGGGQGSSALTPAGSGPNSGHDQKEITNIYSYNDQLHITKGIHSISTGGWAERLQSNETNANFGRMTFSDLPSFLQGRPSTLSVNPSSAVIPWRIWMGAWYFQDSMKLRPNLTLSLGLRHEFTKGWNAISNRAANFIQGPGGVLQDELHVGNNLLLKNRAKKLFGPRAALAWDPFGKGKTSIRAGWGIAYNLLDNIGWCCRASLPSNPQFQITNPPFPLTINPSAGIPASLNARPGGGAGGIQTDAFTPTVFNYRFEVEQGLSREMTVRFAYMGSRGYHEVLRADANTVFPTICPASPCPAGLAAGTKYFPTPVVRRNTNKASQVMLFTSAVNNYNAFYVDLNRRFRGGLAFRTNYTFSKSLDNSSQITGTQAASNQSAVMDPEDRMRDYGLSAFDVRNRFGFNSSYELPLGAGKAFLSGATGVADKLVSGWQLNAILSLQDGFPFTPLLGFSRSRDGNTSNFADRPDMAPGRTRDGLHLRKPEQWIDPTAFALQVAGTYGNAGRDIMTSPGLVSLDLSLFKTTHFSERWNLQFRAEFFNLLNRSNLGLPSTTVLVTSGAPAPAAGRITRTSTTSRQIQFGMKLAF